MYIYIYIHTYITYTYIYIYVYVCIYIYNDNTNNTHMCIHTYTCFFSPRRSSRRRIGRRFAVREILRDGKLARPSLAQQRAAQRHVT